MILRSEQGFLLVSLLLILALMAVTLVTLNLYTATQVNMTALHRDAVQSGFDRHAVLQDSLWQIFSDPCYRTAGEQVVFNGSTYTRTILNSTQPGYTDAITLTIMAQGSTTALKRSYHYWSAGITGTPSRQEQICLDGTGNLFIADTGNVRIVKRDPAGIMTLLAGNGTRGYSGDWGPAVNAQLHDPCGVAVDPGGNIYIADTQNHVIRRVDPSGIITTVAGTGNGNYSGDWGPATAAELNEPLSVFFHNASNSYYIADSKNHRIRRVDSAGIITTVAGNGVKGYSGNGGAAIAARLDTPHGVHVRPDGTIFIADTANSAIRQVDSAGIITTVAGSSSAMRGYSGDGGQATSALLNLPNDVTADAFGNLYIADTLNQRIRRICAATGIIQTVVGSGAGFLDNVPAQSARMNWPKSVAISPAWSPHFFVSDSNNNSIRKITLRLVPEL